MDLHLKTEPATDGITRVLELSQRDVAVPKRSRNIDDLASFVAYLNKWGDPTKATVYWNESRVVALLEETVIERDLNYNNVQDRLTYAFARPLVAERWLAVVGKTFSHKEFKDFLELRFNEIAGGGDLFAKVSNLSLAQTFTFDAKLQDDQNYQVAFKTEGGADVAKLPKFIEVAIPLVKGIEKPYTLKLKLKFEVPTKEDATPTFKLTWDDQKDVLEQVARDAVAEIQTQLPSFLIVNGNP